MAHLDMRGRESLVSTLSNIASDVRVGAIVLVVHRVEDIPPGFTHALLLRGGRGVHQGPLAEVISDSALTDCFGARIHVAMLGRRFVAVGT
jgi:iron complex transport system ATP-binding protein